MGKKRSLFGKDGFITPSQWVTGETWGDHVGNVKDEVRDVRDFQLETIEGLTGIATDAVDRLAGTATDTIRGLSGQDAKEQQQQAAFFAAQQAKEDEQEKEKEKQMYIGIGIVVFAIAIYFITK